jgi:hypothetical protein
VGRHLHGLLRENIGTFLPSENALEAKVNLEGAFRQLGGGDLRSFAENLKESVSPVRTRGRAPKEAYSRVLWSVWWHV